MFPGGFRAIYRDEGWRGLYRGTSLALVGVTNGALQFMAYEKMKSWAFERKRRRFAKLGREWTMQDDKLVRFSFLFCLTRDLALLTCTAAVQYDIHCHISHVEDGCSVRYVPVPSDPIAYPGD
jgi:solute carrier family 25 (mitochondrial folate transporter), member 32